MLDFDVAQSRLATAAAALSDHERVALHQCSGRVLAEGITATLDLPPSDNSAMDGYAIRYADFKPGIRFPVQQHCYAGDVPEPLQPGKTIRLFTGSIMPEGADTVVMQEHTTETNHEMIIDDVPERGRHVRYKGEDVRRGTEIVPKGTLLGAAEISLIASQGLAEVTVFRQLKVGILTTGDELVAPGTPRAPEQIYNSNGAMLAAMTERLGAQVTHVLHAVDTHADLTHAFDTLLNECDLILSVGGVSVGDKDLVKPTIEQLGGTLDLWRVNMKPGRPVALAHARNKPIICLPGNPVSAFVVCALLVSPLIRTMQGRARALPPTGYGVLDTDRVFNDSRTNFLRIRTQPTTGNLPRLSPHHDQGSAILSSLTWADALARIPAHTATQAGDTVPYYDLAHWLT